MKRKKMILILVLLLVVGFASVSTTLVITGVIGVSSKQEDFDIIFTNAKLDGVEKKEFIKGDKKQLIEFTSNKLTTIGETTTLEYDVTNKSRLYDAEVSISCSLLNEAEEPITTNEYVTMEYTPKSMTVFAGKTKTGSITATLTKSSTTDQSIKVKCTLTVGGTERTELGEEYIPVVSFPEGYSLRDANDNGVADEGEEITVGTENFYVISHTDTELNALAKYNLKVGGSYRNEYPWSKIESYLPSDEGYGIQNPLMLGCQITAGADAYKYYGTVAFSNTDGWSLDENNTIDIRNDEKANGAVKEALYGPDGTSGYEKYIQKTIPTATVRLITKSDLETLINDGESLPLDKTLKSKADEKQYQWLYSTAYWISSVCFDDQVYCVSWDGDFDRAEYYADFRWGVRPVITITLS